MWGGDGAALGVAADGSATAEFNCALGALPGPLSVSGDGSFAWPGTFQPERGNPIAPRPEMPPQPATYLGTVLAGTMTLSVDVPSLDHVEGPFTLTFGALPFLHKCQ